MIVANRNSQNGVSLVLAIFVIVVMSLLGAALMNILASGTESVAREVVSVRALMAAESGAQRQLNAIFPPGAPLVTGNCAASPNNWVNRPYTFGGFVGCSDVIVSCKFLLVDSVNYFTLKSTGSCGPSGDQAVRVIEVQAKGS